MFSWVSVEARTGKIITDLPLLDVSTIKQSLGRYETTTATLPISKQFAPYGWERATKKGATHLVLLADNPDDPAHGIPLIGYVINRRQRTDKDVISLDLATAEAYLDRRYVVNKTYTSIGQNAIVSDLITSFIADGVKPGIPIRVQTVTAGTGALRTRTYLDSDDKTVYSALSDLAGVIGGPEWYIGWEWQHNPERITPVLYVGNRIGNPTPTGLGPAATFEIPGSISTIQVDEDYSSGKGATSVIAVSTAQGNVRPQSPAQVDNSDPELPTFEYRYTPSTSISDVSRLTTHAQAALSNLATGALSVGLSSLAAEGPQLGIDWFLGDDVGFVIGGLDTQGKDTVPSFPGGISGVARVLGWELTLSETPVITPILINPIYS